MFWSAQTDALEIVGISRGVEGKVLDLKGALRDLGAKVTEQEIRVELAAGGCSISTKQVKR